LFAVGEEPPLEEKTSAAYGIGRDSIAEAFAERCPVSPFFASTALLGVLPGEEMAHPARADLRVWALSGVGRRRWLSWEERSRTDLNGLF
jgi:hypothetical protein